MVRTTFVGITCSWLAFWGCASATHAQATSAESSGSTTASPATTELAATTGSTAQTTKPYRIAVLELAIEDVGDPLARSLTESMRKQLKDNPNYELRDNAVSLEQLSLAQDCDAEQTSCLERIARSLEVDGLVYGKLINERGSVLARVKRYDLASQTVKSAAIATLATRDTKAADLDNKAHQMVADLFDLEAARSPFSRDELRLRPEPTAAAPVVKPKMSPRKVTGYALLGGAVLSAGLSVLSFVQIDRASSNDTFDRYRRAVGQMQPSVRDVCDEAAAGQHYGLDAQSLQRVQSSCGTGRTFQVLQFVFIGSAVLSSGLSAFLLFGGENADERPLIGKGNFSLHPTVQGRGASLGARFKF